MTVHRVWLFAATGLSFISVLIWRTTDGRTISSGAAVAVDRPIAIVGATVIPMTDAPATQARDPVRLPNYTVMVQAGRIAAVGPSDSMTVPHGVLRIDGRGRFLIPGLVDAHAHLLGRESSADLPVYLVNGVTTVRNMYGEPDHLRWRREIATGARLGPTLLTTSASTDGLTSAAQARAFVRRAREDGYDAVKVHVPLDPSIYDAVASAARSEGIPVVGHAPGRPGGIAAAVRRGQRTIEHAESIMQVETVEQNPDTADIPRIVARLRGSGVCITPTLVTFVHVIRMTEQYPTLHDLLARPEMRFVRAELRASWAPSQNEYVTRGMDTRRSCQGHWRSFVGSMPGCAA